MSAPETAPAAGDGSALDAPGDAPDVTPPGVQLSAPNSAATRAATRAGAPAALAPSRAHGTRGGTLVIAARELGNYFDSRIAYVYTIAFVLLANGIFMNDFFLTGVVDMTGFFDLMPMLLPVFLPAVTMRLWAEEKKQRTIEMLLTMPIRPGQAVVGKFLAALALYGLFLAGSLPIVVMLAALGRPDLGLVVSGYLGLLLFGAMFLALGMVLSALSSDQIVAFVTTTVLGFLFVLLGQEQVVAVLDGLFPSLSVGTWLSGTISVMPHYEAFVRGIVGLPALLYFGGMTAVLLWVNASVLARDRG